MLDRFLIEHCSPTLASIKSANLFNYFFDNILDLYTYISDIEEKLSCKGIYLEILNIREDSALIYVYRKNRLEKRLKDEAIQSFLKQYGYNSFSSEACIKLLSKRIKNNNSFPHEIGIFLDYPLGDVIGFIENKGLNSKYNGYWKVYSNEPEALRIFAQYKKCKQVYLRLFEQGRSISQLTVSA